MILDKYERVKDIPAGKIPLLDSLRSAVVRTKEEQPELLEIMGQVECPDRLIVTFTVMLDGRTLHRKPKVGENRCG